MMDSRDWTPLACLDQAMKAIETEYKGDEPESALVLLRWRTGNHYDTHFFNAGMSIHEAVALLEKVKHDMLHMIPERKEDED